MDTRTADQRADAQKAAMVEAKIAEIKANMPEVYKAIQERAALPGCKGVYALVRRGLAGEPNCFYAFERGRVVGTPFNRQDLTAPVALGMVQFGASIAYLFGDLPAPLADPGQLAQQ